MKDFAEGEESSISILNRKKSGSVFTKVLQKSSEQIVCKFQRSPQTYDMELRS